MERGGSHTMHRSGSCLFFSGLEGHPNQRCGLWVVVPHNRLSEGSKPRTPCTARPCRLSRASRTCGTASGSRGPGTNTPGHAGRHLRPPRTPTKDLSVVLILPPAGARRRYPVSPTCAGVHGPGERGHGSRVCHASMGIYNSGNNLINTKIRLASF